MGYPCVEGTDFTFGYCFRNGRQRPKLTSICIIIFTLNSTSGRLLDERVAAVVRVFVELLTKRQKLGVALLASRRWSNS